jgi:hypothetical protein
MKFTIFQIAVINVGFTDELGTMLCQNQCNLKQAETEAAHYYYLSKF